MTHRPRLSLQALLLCLLPLALLPRAVSAQDDQTGTAGSATSAPRTPGADNSAGVTPENATGDNTGPKPAKEKPAAETAPPQAEPSRLASLLNEIGIGVAAFASLAALVFAVLAWRGATGVQRNMEQASRYATDSLAKIPNQMAVTIRNETQPLKTLSADLEQFAKRITEQIRNVVQSQPAQIANSGGSPGVSPDLILSLTQMAKETRDGLSALSTTTATLTNQNRVFLSALQGGKRQPDLVPAPQQAAPQMPALAALLSQPLAAADALTETGQRLQATVQKLDAGSREGDHFLDNLAQAVFLPLSVPLASPNVTEAQMSYRINLLGAIERTRVQAAAKARGAGLEIMPIEEAKTAFDSSRHDAMPGTEIRTDRAELNGKVAEVLRHGFLQKNKDNSLKVLRKAQVRLFFPAQAKATLPPPAVAAVPEPAPEVPAALPEPQPDLPEPQPDPVVSEAPGAPVGDVQAAQQEIETWRGTSSAVPSNQDWQRVAEALTILHRKQGMDAPALDELLAAIFTDSSPRSIVPQSGEISTPFYEAETAIPGGCVAEVLRVGIEIPREGSPNRPVLPLVRLAPKSESN